MTEREAKKIIECAKAEVEWEYPLDYAIAFDVASEALEKQIPVKPAQPTELEVFHCPKCHGVLHRTPLVHYCDRCGQKLDWG